MASLHKFWKLKASLRSTTGYKGDLAQIGRSKPVFDKDAPSALYTKPFVTESATTPGGCSPLQHPYVFSFFRKFFSSSRTPVADHNPSTVYSSKPQALSPSEALSRVLSVPSIHTPLLERCRDSSQEGTRELTGSSLRELWNTGLSFLTGQQPGVSFQETRKNALKLVVSSISSGPFNEWKEQRFSDRSSTMDTDGVLDAEALLQKTKKLAPLDSRTLVTKGVDRSCIEVTDFELEDGEVDGTAVIDSILPGKATMKNSFRVQLLLNFPYADYVHEPEMAVLKYSYSKYASNMRFAGNGSLGMRFEGYRELHCAKEQSSNLDK